MNKKICFYGEPIVLSIEEYINIFEGAGFEIVSEENAESIFSFDRSYRNNKIEMVYPEEFFWRYEAAINSDHTMEENERRFIDSFQIPELNLTFSGDEVFIFPFLKKLYPENFPAKFYSMEYLYRLAFDKKKTVQLKLLQKNRWNFNPEEWILRENVQNFNFLYKIAIGILFKVDNLEITDFKALEEDIEKRVTSKIMYEEYISKGLKVPEFFTLDYDFEIKSCQKKYSEHLDSIYSYVSHFYTSPLEELKHFMLFKLCEEKLKLETYLYIASLFKSKESFIYGLNKHYFELVKKEYTDVLPSFLALDSGVQKTLKYCKEAKKRAYKKSGKRKNDLYYPILEDELKNMRSIAIKALRKDPFNYGALPYKFRVNPKFIKIIKKNRDSPISPESLQEYSKVSRSIIQQSKKIQKKRGRKLMYNTL